MEVLGQHYPLRFKWARRERGSSSAGEGEGNGDLLRPPGWSQGSGSTTTWSPEASGSNSPREWPWRLGMGPRQKPGLAVSPPTARSLPSPATMTLRPLGGAMVQHPRELQDRSVPRRQVAQ